MSDSTSDAEVLARQYADDTNLRARQRLWEISASDPPFDFNRWSVELAPTGPGDVVLDAGCGNGRPLGLLHERGCTAVGVDLSPGMVRLAHGRALAVADVRRLPFATSAFDAAFALMMLYHVPDLSVAAAELRRVVRPGGVLVATTASRDNQVELRTLVESAVGGGWKWNRASVSFSLENGAAVLRSAFETVERVDAPERRISVTDADAMADYVASSADHFDRTLPPGRRWSEVVDAVRSATADAVTARGAFVVTGKLGAFVCR